MFDQMFEGFKSQFEEWAKSGVEQLGKELNDRFGIPKPDGEFKLLRRFDISEPLISKGCIAIEDNSWRIEAYDSIPQSDLFDNDKSDKPVRNTQLFTFDEPDTEECVIACRALINTSGMNNTARLRLGFERETEFFGMPGGKMSKYYEASILGSQLQEYEVRHHFKKEQYPANFWLNLDFFEPGTIWIRDIKLFTAPAKSK